MAIVKNQLKAKIVFRNDLASEWASKNPVLLQGEVGLERDTNKFKFGDGTKTWNDLTYAGTQVKVEGTGDVIVSAEVNAAGELILTKGKLTLDSVYLTKEFTFTEKVGTVTPVNGSIKYGSADQSLQDFFTNMFAKTNNNPKVTQPSVSITLSNAGVKEVGESFTPSYSASFKAGEYEWGPATGVTVSDYTISDTNSKTTGKVEAGMDKAVTGSFDAFTVTDSTNYKISISATHGAGVVPNSNVGGGTEDTKGQIIAGTKTASSAAVTGYRATFYGSLTSKEGEPTSAVIRGLTKSTSALGAKATFKVAEPLKAMRVIIAVPAPRTCASIKDENGLNAEAVSAFKKISVNVEGANGYEAKAYNVYYKDNAAACDKANNWVVTLG